MYPLIFVSKWIYFFQKQLSVNQRECSGDEADELAVIVNQEPPNTGLSIHVMLPVK